MLEHDDRKHAAAELISSLPCHVELPAELRNNFGKQGAVPFSDADRRRHPRVYCRGRTIRAGLQYQATIPQLPREPVWHSVYITNVSCDGIGFLHSEALYPREKLRLLLQSGQISVIEVVCCRRLHTRCYEIGAQMAAGQVVESELAAAT